MSDGTHPEHPIFERLMKRPVTAFMSLCLILVLGVVANQRIPITLMPGGLSDPEMEVETSYANASPEEVFQQVTKPIEDAVRQLTDIEKVESFSNNGRSRVSVTFHGDADLDFAYAELKDRLERVRATLPENAGKPVVSRWNSDLALPIFWIGVLFESDVQDPFWRVEEVIQKKLQAVDGVAQVGLEGMVEESVRIFVSPERLESHGMTLYEVVDKLRRDNFTLPAGHIDDAGRRFLLRIDTAYTDLEEIRNYPLKEGVFVKDIADVRMARAYRDTVSRVNGKRSLTLTINKESDRNTVEVCAAVREQLEALKTDARLKGFEFTIYFDQSEMIVGAIDNLKSSLLFGAFFSVLVLYAFVRRTTITALVAFAIPISLLAAIIGLYFSGFTFNIVSLAGITLATGMLVDNSIVVTENVLRLRAQGRSPQSAAAVGAGQVALAIVLSTMTTVVVFAPLVFMADGKRTRALLAELGAPISYSLIASLFVALFLLPIATVMIARFERGKTKPFEAPTNTGYHRLYRRLLELSVGNRFATTALVCITVALGSLAFQNLDASFGDMQEGGGRLRLSVDLPDRFTIEEASDVFAQYEKVLIERRESDKVRDVSVRFNRQAGRIMLWFERGTPPNHEKDLAKSLEAGLPKLPGVKVTFGFERGSEDGSIKIALNGPDSVTLGKLSEDVIRELEKLPELSDVKTNNAERFDELRIAFDREDALRYGVTQEVLLGLVSWGIGSQQLSPMKRGSRDLPMLVEFEDPETGDLEYLKGLSVPVGDGADVTLASLGEFSIERNYGAIRRSNGTVSLSITAQSYDENSYRVARRVQEVLEAFPFPEGYGWRDRGQRDEFEASQNEVAIGLLAGCMFMFLLMGMLFESFILPFAVMITIPLALVGGAFSLWITGTPLDSTGMLAFILLSGVVVNNGIVLVDRIQQLRTAGLDRHGAVMEGCVERLRPVLMTALTTIFGLLPMAMPEVFASSSAGGGVDYRGLAVVTLGGMILSTLLTLLVVPMFFTVFDDFWNLLTSMFSSRRPTASHAQTAEAKS